MPAKKRPFEPDSAEFGSPLGPSSAEIAAWPAQLLKDLEVDSPANTAMLKGAFQTGLQVSSDWSGMRTPETGLEAVRALLDPMGPLSMVLQYVYSCDNADAPTAVCLDGLVPADHHFTDIAGRVPTHVQARLDEMEAQMPSVQKGMNAEDKNGVLKERSEAYKAMACFMLKECERGWSACAEKAVESLGRDPKQPAQSLCMGLCARHHLTQCSVGFDPSMISINIAGATCVGFSPYGAHAGTGHESMRVYHTWAAGQRVLKPKVIVFECSHRFPKDRLIWWFEDLYHICFYDHPGRVSFLR